MLAECFFGKEESELFGDSLDRFAAAPMRWKPFCVTLPSLSNPPPFSPALYPPLHLSASLFYQRNLNPPW